MSQMSTSKIGSRITVFLRGGLGNQMFQYAAGIHLAKKHNSELFLDSTFLNDRFPRKEFTYRTFDLDIFTLRPRFTALSKISHIFPVPGFWLGLDFMFMRVREMLGIQRILKEKKEYCFDSSVFPAKGNVVLYGRWQSERYFIDNVDDVRSAFRFKYPFSGEAAALAEQIKNSNSVSLHVRRGDYVNFENMKKIMGDTDLSYYDRAISYVAERVSRPHFFVFSDDIAWCRENMKIPFPATYCDSETAGPKNAFHLELMSFCKHNIITNSTFSWWGAWLNNNSGKIVVAPKKWHADAVTREENIVPETWVKI